MHRNRPSGTGSQQSRALADQRRPRRSCRRGGGFESLSDL